MDLWINIINNALIKLDRKKKIPRIFLIIKDKRA